MDRIVSFLLLLVAAVLLIPGCIAEEQVTPEATVEATDAVAVTEVAAENATVEATEVTEEAAGYDYTADQNMTALNMTVNQTALVQLPENPTTGYTWNVTLSDGLTLLNDTYVADAAPEGMVGVGGIHKWVIEAVASGEQKFSGIEKQAWEKETGNETTYTLDILVE